ncbi:hypothetical protein RIF29_16470 [Crotalaria pallida]|uniref:Ion transport domain-containing protein n=1 Tax=Crotalaria pallida TaxID=3830 RepID=A0AAN9FIX7_CROPI
MAISVDPLFFYIPMINGQRKCIDFDGAWKVIACVLRTFFDVFYILRIIFQFRTGFIPPVFGMDELVDDSMAIGKRYLSSYFIIDVLSIIPLPQMATLAIIRNPEFSVSYVAKGVLKYTVIAQYVPRLVRIYPLFKQVTSKFGILTETAWAGAVYNLFLYMLASHVVGAFWFYSVQWRTWAACFIQVAWRRYLKKKTKISLCEVEERLRALANEEGSSLSIGATVYASRFSSNLLRSLRRGKCNRMPQPDRLLSLLPQKPAEPDFTSPKN